MCGIFGLYSFGSKEEFDVNLIGGLADLQAHRGPDDANVYSQPGFCVGHRRLKIIDLNGGRQPMVNEDNTICLAYNGEIYNYKALRTELEDLGVVFRDESDTEVFLKVYQQFGIDGLTKLRGMFAAAIYDKENDCTILIRDRLGIKPLYYSVFNDKLFFSTEMKSILAYPNFPRDVNHNIISSYLSCFRLNLDEDTIFSEIKCVLPGQILIFHRNGNAQTAKYWKLEKDPSIRSSYPSFEESMEELRAKMKETVGLHMQSDVPFGAFLSGGLDSSILVSQMAGKSGNGLKTFSIGFNDGTNEFEFAQAVAKKYKTDHKEVVMDRDLYDEFHRELIRKKDQPLCVANEVPIFYLSKILKEDISVVLSGEGADELFAGYGLLNRAPHDFELYRMCLNNREWLGEEKASKVIDSLKRQYNEFYFDDELNYFLLLYSWLNFADKDQIFSSYTKDKIESDSAFFKWSEKEFYSHKGLSHYDRYMHFLEKHHLNGLLHRLDTATMAASVEGRVPYADHELVEMVFKLPHWYKLKLKEGSNFDYWNNNSSEISNGGKDSYKHLLKEAFKKDLPTKVYNRDKYAFPTPINAWFGEERKDWLLEEFNKTEQMQKLFNMNSLTQWTEDTLRQGASLKLWMVLNLSYFFQEYDPKV